MNWEKELERRKIDDGKRGLFAAKWKDKKTEALAQREREREREMNREENTKGIFLVFVYVDAERRVMCINGEKVSVVKTRTASRVPCTASHIPCTASHIPCTTSDIPCTASHG